MARERLVVIGGDAAGMSAASQARRQRPELVFAAREHLLGVSPRLWTLSG